MTPTTSHAASWRRDRASWATASAAAGSAATKRTCPTASRGTSSSSRAERRPATMATTFSMARSAAGSSQSGLRVGEAPVEEARRPFAAQHLRQVLVDLLGDEGHDRMEQGHHRSSRASRLPLDLAALLGIVAVEAGLGHLQVPVAHLVPDEAVEQPRGLGEVVALVERRQLPADRREAAEDPPVGRGRQGDGGAGLRVRPLQHQARGVPDLVGEVAPHLDALGTEAHVLYGAHVEQTEAGGVGAVLRDQLQRVHARAQALAHPSAVGRQDRRMDDDVAEGDLARELQAHHDHPRHPQVDDVPGGGQHRGRIELAQFRGVSPASPGWRTARAPS